MPSPMRESLLFDPIHGYIPFTSIVDEGETSERTLLDHPWLQRMRQIHQLQTAWWVYPSAEHTRFQHVVGAMHMASRAVAALYESLREVCPDAPSRGYVECTMRLAALLHDVGHGPFGHFFDAHFLSDYRAPDGSRLTHEVLGAHIIRTELGDLLRGVRRCPNSCLESGERIDPDQIAWLIQRPSAGGDEGRPRWLALLRSLFCGLYTVDNMDFVLRDAYMSGYSERAYDLDRLLRYSFFSEKGLTIHQRGMNALLRFMHTKSELFRTVYFHRTVRAIDKTLEGLFRDGRKWIFPGNPLEHLAEYREFTEWSLLVDVARWHASDDPAKRALGERWRRLLARQMDWESVCERNLLYGPGDAEAASIFSDAAVVEQKIRALLPGELAGIEMQIDLPRHIYRPHSQKATAGQNFLLNAATGAIRPLTDDQLFRQLPVAHRMCRIYLRKDAPRAQRAAVGAALDQLVGAGGEDDLTNM
jgi:HD superfamily phosphohydrolase